MNNGIINKKSDEIQKGMKCSSTTEKDMLLGMPRIQTMGIALGLSVGMVLSGAIPMMGYPWLSEVWSCIVFSAIGYLVSYIVYRYNDSNRKEE